MESVATLQLVKMAKNLRTFKLFKFFHSLSKFAGFLIIKFDDSIVWCCVNVFCLLLNISVAFGCTIRSEMWCLQMFDSFYSLKRLILFVILQIITFTPMTMLLFYQIINRRLPCIILRTIKLIEKLNSFRITFNIATVKLFGILVFGILALTNTILVYVSIALTLPIDIIIDSVCMPFFEFWDVVPCIQFINWILLLDYIIQRVQNEIIEFKDPNYRDIFVPICSKLQMPQSFERGHCCYCKLVTCKCRFAVNTIKEVSILILLGIRRLEYSTSDAYFSKLRIYAFNISLVTTCRYQVIYVLELVTVLFIGL